MATNPIYSPSGGAIIPQNGSQSYTLQTPSYVAPKETTVVPQSIIDNAKTNPATTYNADGKDVFGQPIAGYTAPTIGQAYSSSDPYAAAGANLKSTAETPVNEDQVRNDVIKRFQAQIDYTNNIYASKLAAAKVQGAGREGQTNAINARRGLAGSDFGVANTNTVQDANNTIYGGIDEERMARVQGLMSEAANKAADEIAAKNTARMQGQDKYIAFLRDADTRRATKTSEAAKAAVASGIDLTTDKATLKQLASTYGISEDALLSEFGTAKSESEKQKAALELSKAQATKATADAASPSYGPGTIGEFQYRASLSPEQRQQYDAYQTQDANRKAVIAKATSSSGLTNYQQTTTFNHIVDKYNASPLIQAADRTPVLAATIQKIKGNPGDAAQQLNLSYAYIQALDTYQSAVREGELHNLNTIDSKIGGFQNYLQQIQSGQVVRPEVALKIAAAAQDLVDTISSAAQAKSKSFSAQARVAGVGDNFDQYQSSFKASYDQGGDTSNKADPLGIL